MAHGVRGNQPGFDGVAVLLERPRGGGDQGVVEHVEHRHR